MKRIFLAVSALALAATALIAVPGLTGSAGAADDSQVYVVHGIPGVPVDVYVNGTLTIADFQPKAVAGPLQLAAGNYHVQIFAHVTDPPQSAPASGAVLDANEAVPAGKSISLIANLDEAGNPALNAFVNDTDSLASGMARVTVRHTASAPAVDVTVDGSTAVSGLANPNEAVAAIPAGSHEIAVKLAGTDTTVLGPVTLDFAAGTNTIVYAIGSAQRQTLDVVVQTLSTAPPAPTTTVPSSTPTTTMPPAPSTPAAPVNAQPTFTG